jgi:hypothetical protein
MKKRGPTVRALLQRGAAAAVLVLLGACATDPEPDNLRFGAAVRHMISVQTADPNAGARGLDGEKAEQALRAYRGDVGSRESVNQAKVSF